MARKLAAVVFTLGCLEAGSVMALGLGELKLESFLNEPLNASVDLLNMGGLHADEVKIRLATREDFAKMGLDRAYFLTSITFEVEAGDGGRPHISVTSEDPVLEPYLDFIVEARWPSGRLLREYTVLIDPPVFSDATPTVSASERVEAVEGIPAPTKKNEELAATSGTRVDVKQKSELAPGAMPQRDFNASAGGSPAPGGRYMISRDDTLWQIASQARPDGVSVHQTMLDIQRMNPDAFLGGNINRIKAGYIIYLPGADDISSADLDEALTEVREQNNAWREGRDLPVAASAGPSLRISADTEAAEQAADTAAGSGTAAGSAADSGAMAEELDKAALEGADADERAAAMQARLETLERIVNLKDEQIAALQQALAEQGDEDSTGFDTQALTDDADVDVAEEEFALAEGSLAEAGAATDEELAVVEPEDAAAAPEQDSEVSQARSAPTSAAKPVTPAAQPAAAQGGGLMDYLVYILGALGLAIVGFFIVRRRNRDEEDSELDTFAGDEAFSGVQLQDQALEVESSQQADAGAQSDHAEGGYGERRHDEYASDVEAADALAEADIYIAYGRHSQAVDLLNNALAGEPGNPVYRLKLLEIHQELGDEAAAREQLHQLRALGDADALAQAEALFEAGAIHAEAVAPEQEPQQASDANEGPGLAPNPLDLMSDSGEELEADFADLEIESSEPGTAGEEELDLSVDFKSPEQPPGDDEDLVIAADANGLSTKLDLARAYLDMGDDDGARQILDEVIAEGSEELKAEARSLLERIG